MPVGRSVIGGSPYLGVYLRVGERFALLPPSTPAGLAREVEGLFGVQLVRSTVGDTDLLGALVAFNSKGVVVGELTEDLERLALARIGEVHAIPGRHNALGNNVLANDRGALVHPDFSPHAVEQVGRALGVKVRPGTLAGLGTVGMAGIATNRGVVVHPRTTEKEARIVEETLEVPVHRSTANFGVPIVGACLVANSRAFLTGRPTTPVEIVHLQEGLGVVD